VVILVLLLVVVVVGLGYVFRRHAGASDPLKNVKPALYQPPQNASGNTLALPNPRR
jgi:hypothetical protein